MIHRDRRSTLATSHSDALADAAGLVAFPFLLGLLGWWVDGKLGTGPVLMLSLIALAVVGSFATAYYRYVARIAQHEADTPWTRKRGR